MTEPVRFARTAAVVFQAFVDNSHRYDVDPAALRAALEETRIGEDIAGAAAVTAALKGGFRLGCPVYLGLQSHISYQSFTRRRAS